MRPPRTVHPALLIALRELTTRIRSRTFAITTVLYAAGIVAFIVLQATVFGTAKTITVAFVGDVQSIAAQVRSDASSLGLMVMVQREDSETQGEADVRSGTLDALVAGAATAPSVTVKTQIDATFETALNDVVRLRVLTEQLTQRAIDPSGVVQQVVAAGVHVNTLEPIDAARVQQIVVGLLVAGTLYIGLQIYGNVVAASIVEEKSNRIVELLLAAVRPWHLLSGKVVGIGLLGFVQLIFLVVVAVVAAAITHVVSLSTLGVSVVASGVLWYVIGFLMYATACAGAATLVSRQEEIASAVAPLTIVIVVGWVLTLVVAAPDPGGAASTALSLIPPMSPLVMPVRIAAGAVPAWQVALSVGLSLATIYGLTAAAARIYRHSVLRTGPKVKLTDALGLNQIGVGKEWEPLS